MAFRMVDSNRKEKGAGPAGRGDAGCRQPDKFFPSKPTFGFLELDKNATKTS